ncbi:MAG: DNA primase, partial [Microbacterium gubbeenense]
STNQRGGVYDRFRGRLVWPIRDVTGQTIGFGARKLYDEDQGPKYLNTPETPIYKKNQVLYGLDLAKRDISRGEPKRVIVVEGYTDVMACHLAGLTTAVATCGTAFGSEHIRTLRRVMGDDSATGEVVFTFDGDEAGQKAALRAFADADRFSAQTFVAVAPDGLDPCDMRLQRGDAAVRALLDHRVPMFEFVIDRKLAGFPLTSVEGRVGALRAAAPIVAEIKDRLIRPGYERVLAQRLGMDPTDVHREVENAARGARQEERSFAPAPTTAAPATTLSSLPRTTDVAVERDALTGILQYGHRIEPTLMHRALEAKFRTPALDVVRAAISSVDRSRPGWGQAAIDALPQALRQLGGEVLMRDFPARDEEHAAISANDLCRRIIVRGLDQRKRELLGEVQRVAPESEEGRAVRLRLRDIDQERRLIAGE